MSRLPSSDKLWKRHEQLVLNVLECALVKLQNENNLPEEEIKLNDLLYVYAREVWCKLPKNKKPSGTLSRNSEIPPRIKSEIGQRWTKKKPDFLWSLSDPLEEDPAKAIRDYTIECKRLRTKTKTWDFINEYVVNGIIRFFTEEHKYGIGTLSGAMIGYIQNMEHDEILKQINTIIQNRKDYKIPPIEFSQKGDEIRKGNHTLNREKVNPSVFDLCHIWVNLKKIHTLLQ